MIITTTTTTILITSMTLMMLAMTTSEKTKRCVDINTGKMKSNKNTIKKRKIH